jgi:cyclopropane fatty-acyl-phospholipid synthase-like methyltransferase
MQQQYDEWGQNPPEHVWCNEQSTQTEVTFLKNALHLRKTQAILDLFCSWGRHAIALAQEGYMMTGVDISPSMIAHAQKKAAETGCAAHFMVADVQNLCFEEPFDVVYNIQSSLFEAWRTLDEIIDMLRCVREVLCPGGKYLFGWSNDWNRADMAAPRWEKELKRAGESAFEHGELPFQYYGMAEQTQLVTQAGFCVVRAFNNYENWAEPYSAAKPGLILLVEKGNVCYTVS